MVGDSLVSLPIVADSSIIFFFSFRRSSLRRPDSKSIEFIHGRLPKARQTRRVPTEIELKSNGPANQCVNKSTRTRNAITVYKTSGCFSRAHKFPLVARNIHSGRLRAEKEGKKEKRNEGKKTLGKKEDRKRTCKS